MTLEPNLSESDPAVKQQTPGTPRRGSFAGRGATILQMLGCLVFAGHALHAGHTGVAAAILPVAALGFTRRGFAPLILGPALVLMALGLAGAGLGLVRFRLAAEEPLARLAVIMAVVTALCLTGGLWALSARGRRPYDRGSRHAVAQAAAFWLTVGLLTLVRARTPVPILLADRFAPGWGPLAIAAIGLYAAWLTGVMLDAKRTGPIRSRYWAAFSLIFFGQLALGLAGVTACLMTGALHLPVPALIVAGPVFRGGGYFMPILYLATVLLVGPGWCSHLCYIGAADDACAGSGPETPARLSPRRTWWRLATLVLAVGVAAGLRHAGVAGQTAVWLAAGFGLAGLGVMATLSRKTGVMVHCTTYCPIGLVGNLLGKVSPWRIRIAPDCDGCGRCTRVCRYLALTPADLARGRPGLSCTLCGDCTGVCPGDRIHYRFPGLSPQAARVAFFTLVVSLHAVFLGVARI